MSGERIVARNSIYTIKAAAKAIGIDEKVLRQMVKDGSFPSVKYYEGGNVRICGWQILRWLREKTEEGGQS